MWGYIKMFRKLFFLVIAAALIASPTALFASGYAKGQVLVVYSDSASISAVKGQKTASLNRAAAVAKYAGASLTAAYPELTSGSGQTIAVITSATKTTDELAAELAKNPEVKAVARNYAHKLTAMKETPNDPGYSQQWGPKKIGVPEVWSAGKEVKEVYAAVLDTGVIYDHPDLEANMCPKLPDGSYGKMFHYPVSASNDVITNSQIETDIKRGGTPKADITSPDIPSIDYATVGDINGHGTHVAGIIGAVQNNGIGIAGVARKVKIIPVGIFTLGKHTLEGNISPEYFGAMNYDSSIIAALNYLITLKKDYGVNVVVANLSLGDWMKEELYDFNPNTNPVALAMKAASDAGIIICLAAGNEGQDLNNPTGDFVGYKEYPATFRFDTTLSVGASASDDQRGYIKRSDGPYYFSNYSSKEDLVDIFAPGCSIYSTTMTVDIGGTGNYDTSGYAAFSGTSMATPMTAGAAALLASIYPEKSAVEIKSLLLNGTEQNVLKAGYSSRGLLNVNRSYLLGKGENSSSGCASAPFASVLILFCIALPLVYTKHGKKAT